MLLDTLDYVSITALRLMGYMMAAYAAGKLVGEVLGKRNALTYVQDILD